MLEETLIRETAQAKAQSRSSNKNIGAKQPVTFASPTPPKASEETKGAATNESSNIDLLNENTFDIVKSPMMRRHGGTMYIGS